MPIKNLTDRASVTPRFTRLGVIKKGERVGEGKGTRLVDLEYFRFTTDRQEVAQAFFDAFGEQPVSICCFLPYRTMEENWQTWKEEWGYSGLIHRCDGEIMVQWLNADKTYTRDYEQSRQAKCPYACGEKERTADNPGCSEVGRLSIIVPKLLQAGFFGYVTVETHSIHDLANITNSIVEAENKAREFGCERGLQGIGFVLRRQFEEVGIRYQKRDGDYVKTRGNKWMIRLDPSRAWARRQMEIAQAAAFALPVPDMDMTALPSAVIVDGDNDAIASLPEIIEETEEVINGQFAGFDPASISPTINVNAFYILVTETIPYYKHKNHIINAYKKIQGDDARLCNPDGTLTMSPRDVWSLLKEHADAHDGYDDTQPSVSDNADFVG